MTYTVTINYSLANLSYPSNVNPITIGDDLTSNLVPNWDEVSTEWLAVNRKYLSPQAPEFVYNETENLLNVVIQTTDENTYIEWRTAISSILSNCSLNIDTFNRNVENWNYLGETISSS